MPMTGRSTVSVRVRSRRRGGVECHITADARLSALPVYHRSMSDSILANMRARNGGSVDQGVRGALL